MVLFRSPRICECAVSTEAAAATLGLWKGECALKTIINQSGTERDRKRQGRRSSPTDSDHAEWHSISRRFEQGKRSPLEAALAARLQAGGVGERPFRRG